MENYKYPMMVQFEDGTMGHQRWEKKVTGIVFYSAVCSFGLGGGRYCVLDLKDSPQDASLCTGKCIPDIIVWHALNIEKFNQTVEMLKEDGYNVDPICIEKRYKAIRLEALGRSGPVESKKVSFNFKLQQTLAGEDGVLRACRYCYQ